MSLPDLYHQLILELADDTGASDSLMHVHAGMAVLFLARLVTRKSLATIVPFSVVCVAEFANELMDRIHLGYWRFPDTAFDVVNTLFWPFMLMIGLRWRNLKHGRTGGGS